MPSTERPWEAKYRAAVHAIDDEQERYLMEKAYLLAASHIITIEAELSQLRAADKGALNPQNLETEGRA